MSSLQSSIIPVPKPGDKPSKTNASPTSSGQKPPRGIRFWMIFVSLALSSFLAALELSSVATALPIIVGDLHGSEFVWVGSAYALSATAFLPMSGGLAQVFGRRPVMLGSLLIFAAGSAVCGAAPSMRVLIVGRTVQGLGGGGLTSLTQIILSDIVPLRERGMFNGLIGLAWGVASFSGPVIGGSLAKSGNWRWLFYLNIPLCGLAATLVLLFLRLRTPAGTFQEKIARMDWIGNLLVIASSTACIIALTWGGIQYSWSSAHVLVPLLVGLSGLVVFVAYEALIAKYPLVPFSLLSTITGVSGYLQTFIAPILTLAFAYYLPVYFQACEVASPIASGVYILGFALGFMPSGILSGISVTKSHQYRPQLWSAWVFFMVGGGLLSTLKADSLRSKAIGFQTIAGIGSGVLAMTTYFPVLSPLPVSANASALALFAFCRNFGQLWGVTVGGTVLQNELKRRLPSEFVSAFPAGTSIAYAVIPLIGGLEQPLKDEVRIAFAESISVIWKVCIGIAGLGLIISLGMKHLPLHTHVDEDWGVTLESSREEREVEATIMTRIGE